MKSIKFHSQNAILFFYPGGICVQFSKQETHSYIATPQVQFVIEQKEDDITVVHVSTKIKHSK